MAIFMTIIKTLRRSNDVNVGYAEAERCGLISDIGAYSYSQSSASYSNIGSWFYMRDMPGDTIRHRCA